MSEDKISTPEETTHPAGCNPAPYAPIVVGFGHRARQGKDTCIKAIVDAYGNQFDIKVYGFGDALKEEVNKMDQLEICLRAGIAYDYDCPMDDPLCQTKHGKQSRLLQYWGEYRRKQDPFYWVKLFGKKISEEKPSIILIRDMRYKNEFAFVKAMKGLTVRVQRQGFVDLTRDPRHISETDLETAVFDIEVSVKDGELEQLKEDAVTVFKLIIAQYTPTIDESITGIAQVNA